MPDDLILYVKSSNAEATRRIGREIGSLLSPGAILALEGGLGSGKTVFVQGLARGLGVTRSGQVRSPTFALIQEYPGRVSLCHADLYRLSPSEIAELGLEEYWREISNGGRTGWVVAVEWADKARWLIPSGGRPGGALQIRFEILSANERTMTFRGAPAWRRTLKKWKRKRL